MVNAFLFFASGLPVGLGTVLILGIAWKLRKNDRKAMASFQLKKEATLFEFKVLGSSGLPLVIGGIVYALGGYLEVEMLRSIGFTGSIFSVVQIDYVLVKWWRRF
ncbi:MAG: hypothetical protein ABEJ93_04420 [Candidatus Nanohalobium sp.]